MNCNANANFSVPNKPIYTVHVSFVVRMSCERIKNRCLLSQRPSISVFIDYINICHINELPYSHFKDSELKKYLSIC